MAILLTTFMSPSSSSTSIEGGGVYCSMPSGVVTPGWTRLPFDGRRVSDVTASVRNLLFGAVQSHWLSTGHDLCLSRVSVASNYSDSVPHSFSHIGNGGYHPLEELKVSKRCRDTMLTTAEIARTAVEANNNALLVFPGSIHCEPHGHISWAEFQYVIDDYGDIFFEILEDENILRDRGAINPVNVFIGKDILLHGSNMSADIRINDNIPFEDGDFEVVHIEPLEDPLDWGMPDTSRYVHPVYFAKCLTKAINTKYEETMDHPSNRISILGYLRPALVDDESYIRGHFRIDNGDGYSNWKGEPQFEEGDLSTSFPLIDGEIFNLHSEDDGSNISSTLYKLEIIQIELLSVYGVQSTIGLQNFQEAEPDILVHSASIILEHFSEKGLQFSVALKSLCRKKGHDVKGAKLIAVDSLGMDVRVFEGVQVLTVRIPFKSRARCKNSAEKKIQQLLFPRYRRKKPKDLCDGLKDPDCF